jgi:hypothetical protein
MADGILDPDRVSEAGAAFGQVASRPVEGALVVASARFVEHNTRAVVLLVPDLFRVDLAPTADTIGTHLRDLSSFPTRWTSAPDAWDAARRDGGHTPVDFHGEFDFPDRPLAAFVRLIVISDFEAGGAYIAARATVGGQ